MSATPISPADNALALVSQQLASHCIVTVQTGTNYGSREAAALPREEVKTVFSLRFAGAYPFKVKGLKNAANELDGFELTLSGPDECEQLIRALEHAASELRWQAALPAEVLLPAAKEPADERRVAEAEFYVAELDLLSLLLAFGNEPIAGGPTVARYLRSRVQQLPPLGTVDAWGRVLGAMDQNLTPTLDWLDNMGQDAELVQRLRPMDPGPVPEGYSGVDAHFIQTRCEQVVANYVATGLRVEHLHLLDALEEETDADKRRELLRQASALEGQRVALGSRILL